MYNQVHWGRVILLITNTLVIRIGPKILKTNTILITIWGGLIYLTVQILITRPQCIHYVFSMLMFHLMFWSHHPAIQVFVLEMRENKLHFDFFNCWTCRHKKNTKIEYKTNVFEFNQFLRNLRMLLQFYKTCPIRFPSYGFLTVDYLFSW